MPEINVGDTAFIIMCTALVLFMTPGLALFYGGLVRSKNVLSTTMHSLFAMGLISIVWALAGYTIAFGSTEGPLGAFIGGFEHLGLAGTVGQVSGTIPMPVFAMFQGMFAIITAALISGAFAERIKFTAYAIFIAVWSLVVYAPLAHWVWGGGWLAERGGLDFAGGTVVHIASAAAALAGAIALGRRKGFGTTTELKPHNVPMTVLGAGMLWFGWFGFNAGSALAADGIAGNALMVTHLAASAAMISWVAAEWLKQGKPTALGAASGAVAGLVVITPAAGFVTPMPSIVMGLLAGVACYFALSLKTRFGFDDALDVVGIHGVGGALGAVLTGVFATTLVNEGGADGLFYGGGTELVIEQIFAVVVTIVFSFVMSFAILKVIDMVIGLRVSAEAEEAGCDLAEHAETGYVL
jgi:ammonium transporter, Amt family